MVADKHSDLPASERHLGWAISAVMAGAMVRRGDWAPGTHWVLDEVGGITWVTDTDDSESVVLSEWVRKTGFYIYEPEPEDAPEPTYGERIIALEAECKALRQLVKGEFDSLSARITEVSSIVQSNVESLRRAVSSTELSVQATHRVARDNRDNLEKTGDIMNSRIGELGDRVKTLENGTTRGAIIGGVDLSKLR